MKHMAYKDYCKAIENMTPKDANRLGQIRHQACKDNSNPNSNLHSTASTFEISMLFLAMNDIRDRIAKEKERWKT